VYLPEGSFEVASVAPTNAENNLVDAQPGVFEKLFGAIEPEVSQEKFRRCSGLGGEEMAEP